MQDERAFYSGFLESLSVSELTVLQHDLRRSPEDARYLRQVLEEFKRRATEVGAARREGDDA